MSHYKPYQVYRDSGVEWFGDVPDHWKKISLKWVSIRYSGGTPDKTIKNYWKDGTIPWLNSGAVNDDYITEPSAFITEEAFNNSSAKWIPKDALVMALAGQGKTKGMVGQLGFKTTCNQSMAAIIPDDKHILPRMLYWWFKKNYINIRHMGGGEARDGLNLDMIGAIPIPIPPLSEQLLIVTFLDRETARIDAMANKKNRFIELVTEKILAMVTHSFEHQDTRRIQFQHISKIINRQVFQQDGNSYTRLGLYNRGRGAFKKEAADNEDMGDSDFFWVEEGDLILSGQFAWEGAVALATKEHSGCVVSHRFPVIHGRNGEALTEYLLAFFMTDYGDFILNDCSRGSAGRNRPLNINALQKWKIPIPSIEYQKKIALLVNIRERLRIITQHSIALLKERRSAVITAAVTGQIDLRESK